MTTSQFGHELTICVPTHRWISQVTCVNDSDLSRTFEPVERQNGSDTSLCP